MQAKPRESGAELWVVQEPPAGRREGRWGPQEPREGTGHQGISVEVVRRRWSARADPVMGGEMRCSVLRAHLRTLLTKGGRSWPMPATRDAGFL